MNFTNTFSAWYKTNNHLRKVETELVENESQLASLTENLEQSIDSHLADQIIELTENGNALAANAESLSAKSKELEAKLINMFETYFPNKQIVTQLNIESGKLGYIRFPVEVRLSNEEGAKSIKFFSHQLS